MTTSALVDRRFRLARAASAGLMPSGTLTTILSASREGEVCAIAPSLLATGQIWPIAIYASTTVWPLAEIYFWPVASMPAGMTADFPSRSLDKVIVRLPDGMRDMLKAAAEANNRSLNAEIVTRLSLSIKEEGAWRTRRDENNAVAEFASALMAAMHASKKIGRTVQIEVNVPDDLKPDTDEE